MDFTEQFYFWKLFFVENIKSGTIPFWNPYSFSGTPFLAHPSVAAFYPFNIIFFIFPLTIAFYIFLFVHVFLAGFFMYHLASRPVASRPGLERGDKLGALASAVIFALSGMMAARIYSGHIDIISTLIWIPAVFGSVTSAINHTDKKSLFLSVLFLTLQILAGYQAVVVFTLELIFIYQLVIIVLSHCEPKVKQSLKIIRDSHASLAMTDVFKSFSTLFFIIVMSLGISAIQILPTLEFVRNSIRSKGLPYEMLTWGSYKFDQFLMFINPFRYGNPFPESYSYSGPGPNFFEISYYVGIIPIILFLVFIIHQIICYCLRLKAENFSLRSKNNSFIGLAIALLFFSLAAMGNNFPLHKLLYQIFPFYRLFRFPSQHLIIAVFIISLVAGLSVNLIRSKSLKLVILLLITFELVSYDKEFIRPLNIPTASFDHNLTSILTNNRELARLLPDYPVTSQVRKSWDFESSMYYKIYSTSGYNPILLDNYYRFIDLLNKNSTSSITQFNVEIPPPNSWSSYIDFLNIKYVLADKNYDAIANNTPGKYKLKFEGQSYRFYENTDFLPRYFIVDQAKIYSTEHDLENALLLGKLDSKSSIGLVKKDIGDKLPQEANCQNLPLQGNALQRDVVVVDYSINRIKLKTNSSCNSYLSTSEVYYPGWQAKTDNRQTPIYKSNTAFRSVFLPKGEHEVFFYYQPTIYYIGGLISLGSLIMAVIILRRYQ